MSSTKKRWWYLVGNLFNFRRLQVVIKANEVSVRHFLFPDDCALNTATETYKQLSIDCFSTACDNLGGYNQCHRNWHSTPVCHTDDAWGIPASTVKEEIPKTVWQVNVRIQHTFQICQNGRRGQFTHCQGQLSFRTTFVMGLGKEKQLPWQNSRFTSQRCCLHYCIACETWSVYERHIQEINQLYQNCRRNQLKITWGDKVPDTEVFV